MADTGNMEEPAKEVHPAKGCHNGVNTETTTPEISEPSNLESPQNSIRNSVYLFLANPASSTWAMAWSYWILALTVLSVIKIVLESTAHFRGWNPMGSFYCELVFAVFFSIDFFGRLFTCADWVEFLKTPLNIVDFVSILPFFIDLITLLTGNVEEFESSYILRALRMCRLFRLFKMLFRSLILRLFLRSLVQAKDSVVMLLFTLLLQLTILSTCMFYAEVASCELRDRVWYYTSGPKAGERTFFQNIPVTSWWCIVTITTTGYGDTYPQTVWGRVVGVISIMTAIVMFAFPVTLLSNAFREAISEYDSAWQERRRVNKLKKARASLLRTLATKTGVNVNPEALDDDLLMQEMPVHALERVSLELEELRRQIVEKETAQRLIIARLGVQYQGVEEVSENLISWSQRNTIETPPPEVIVSAEPRQPRSSASAPIPNLAQKLLLKRQNTS